jgi:hypothetical protein
MSIAFRIVKGYMWLHHFPVEQVPKNSPFFLKTQVMETITVRRKHLPPIFHRYAMDHLYVTRMRGSVLMKHIAPNIDVGTVEADIYYYIECSKFGVVDWKNCKIHEVKDLVVRDNVFLVEAN